MKRYGNGHRVLDSGRGIESHGHHREAHCTSERISLALGGNGDRTLFLGRKDCQGCKGEERKEIWLAPLICGAMTLRLP